MAHNNKLDDYSGSPLTEEENRKARRMIDSDERARWLWGTMHRLVIAVGAVAAALTAAKMFLGGLWK